MKTITTWQQEQAFQSEYDNYTIELNGAVGADGLRLGFSPKALLLSGIAGCSGIDVVDILQKMKIEFSELVITAEAEQTEDHPKVFTDILVTYALKANTDDEGKVRRAIELSLDKYCGVAAMLRKNSAINYKLEIIGL